VALDNSPKITTCGTGGAFFGKPPDISGVRRNFAKIGESEGTG
jgi:hypothetical protein